MKINWKVRARNPLFWLTVIPSFITLIYSILGLFNVVPSVSQDNLIKVMSTVISTLTTYGVLIDPTTKGTCDSKDAMDYDKPKE